MDEELHEYYSDDNPSFLLTFRELLHYLLVPVLLLLVVVLYLEFFAHIGHALHEKVVLAERLILFYFVAEVTTDFVLFENKSTFLREKWFDILLIIPFLAAFRAIGRVGKLLKGVRSLQLLQLGEIPVAAGLVAGESIGGAKVARTLPKLAKYTPKMQKFLHLVRELPAFATYIPNVQSIVYLLSQAKQSANTVAQFLPTLGVMAFLSSRAAPLVEKLRSGSQPSEGD